jgi:transcriptional regulator with XRE-family HTH domain
MDLPDPPLRAFRHSRTPRMPLHELANRVGLSESQMSRVEREGTNSLPLALKLAEVTGLPVETFAAGEAA